MWKSKGGHKHNQQICDVSKKKKKKIIERQFFALF